ncbi:MAG: hypothetical protein IPL90_19710 [Holophagales bacterium]|nr:hypothetical protein [Holophagales bacterium]
MIVTLFWTAGPPEQTDIAAAPGATRTPGGGRTVSVNVEVPAGAGEFCTEIG